MPSGLRFSLPGEDDVFGLRRAQRLRDCCSPSTQRIASTRFDLPDPFGPTIAVMPWPNSSAVGSANVLKPKSQRLQFQASSCHGAHRADFLLRGAGTAAGASRVAPSNVESAAAAAALLRGLLDSSPRLRPSHSPLTPHRRDGTRARAAALVSVAIDRRGARDASASQSCKRRLGIARRRVEPCRSARCARDRRTRARLRSPNLQTERSRRTLRTRRRASVRLGPARAALARAERRSAVAKPSRAAVSRQRASLTSAALRSASSPSSRAGIALEQPARQTYPSTESPRNSSRSFVRSPPRAAHLRSPHARRWSARTPAARRRLDGGCARTPQQGARCAPSRLAGHRWRPTRDICRKRSRCCGRRNRTSSTAQPRPARGARRSARNRACIRDRETRS